MSRTAKTLMSIGLSLGLVLAAALEGAPRPKPPATPATCPTCPIVYVQSPANMGSGEELWLMQANGTDKTVLFAGARGVSYYSPVWTPDGEWISVASNRGDGVWRLWLVRRDGESTEPAVSLEPALGCSSYFAWRPVPVTGTTHTYWLVYWTCEVNVPHGLWAVKVDLGETPPRILPDPVCLTRDESLIASSWHWPAWTGDGTHLSAYEFVREDEPRNYKVFDFVDDPADSAGPRLANPKVLFTGPLTYGLRFEWAHTRNTLVVAQYTGDPRTELVWFDVDHDGETLATASGCLTCRAAGDDDGWSYTEAHWSPDDLQLLFFARTPVVRGLFVSWFGSAIADPMPIAVSNYKQSRNERPSWNPNPNPQRP